MSTPVINLNYAKERFLKKFNSLKSRFESGSPILTKAQFRACIPTISETNAEKYYTAVVSTLIKYGITSKLRIAHFLAQVGHECMSFSTMAEAGYLSEEKRRAYYLKTYSSKPSIIPDQSLPISKWYIGRGAIQLTHDYNYREYSKEAGKENDIMQNPSLIETTPNYAVDAAGWYWNKHSLNVYADQDNLLTITKKINGGTNGLEDRSSRLEVAKRALGL